MKPVDTFLQSVRDAFQQGDGVSGGLAAGLVAGVAAIVVVAILVARWLGRRAQGRASRAAFAQLLIERRLSADDGRVITRLAARAGVAPAVLATHLDVFERATAAELADHVAVPTAGAVDSGAAGDDAFARIHRLRRALGFHVVPDHVPLLTTRELVPGTPAAANGLPGTITAVTEGWFTVGAAPGATLPTLPTAATATVTFTRGHDARYVVRCVVALADPPRAPTQLFLRHDERPERHQLRATVRVSARGTIELSPRVAAPAGDAHDGHTAAATIHGTLIDISVGGVAMQSPVAVPVGAALHAAITWQGDTYRDLPVWVLHCDARAGAHVVRLEFRGLPATEDARLATAIARQSARVDDKPAPPEGTG